MSSNAIRADLALIYWSLMFCCFVKPSHIMAYFSYVYISAQLVTVIQNYIYNVLIPIYQINKQVCLFIRGIRYIYNKGPRL